jgi:hypothetical protein
MYPQCRHVRTNSDRCHAAAIKGSHWCYYHTRLHQQQEVARRRLEASRQPRLTNGLFAPTGEAPEGIADHGYPAPSGTSSSRPERRGAERSAVLTNAEVPWDTAEAIPLELPPVEDSASIQLALIQVLQALATNQLDPRRAGLLLYGLQVASANAKNVHVHANSIRSISYTSEGIPLATQEHGWDVEDIEEADREAEEEEEYED